MRQQWQKLGRIFSPSGENNTLHSHAALPIAEHLEDNFFKIYFSSRDQQNRSFTNYVIIDITEPTKILDLSSLPVLCPGELGTFDDSGAMATWITVDNDKKFLYYIGWNLGKTVPFRNSIGLAISNKKGHFIPYSTGPIVDRSIQEPHFCASCCVLPGKDYWRMWYLSCTSWHIRKNQPHHKYHIKYASSSDGINWHREGKVAIDFKDNNEYAISRPSVIHDSKNWKMWYSFRGFSYRIGYAESVNGFDWTRLDSEVGIDVSPDGWDSEMIEYPFVFDHQGERYMLYNGNGFGKTGFGLARLIK